MIKTDTSNYSNVNTPKILAVDFDGTLVQDKFPNIGELNVYLFELIKSLKKSGVKVILWTCRTDYEDGPKYLTDAINFCSENGLVFDAVNDNIEDVKQSFGKNPRKILANWYLDDKNIDIATCEMVQIICGKEQKD